MTHSTPQVIDATLRSRHRDLTRRLIVDAFTQVILREGLHEFSMQAVAEEARCSLRTLYRYFPNREALMNGLNAEVQQFVEAVLHRVQAEDSTDFADLVERLVIVFAERRDLMRAWNAAEFATDLRSSIGVRVRELIDQAIAQAAPSLAPDEHARAFAGLRQVVTSRVWLALTDQLNPEEAAYTAGWMVRALLADIASGGGPKTPEIRQSPSHTRGG